ncbi:MAG TPA: hypothetical protein DCM08_09235 [Microscillaceae bacterium]|jgi:hypothetical protein|nr:hypothetical protein [Microscillaceae bacterium]
MQTQPDSSLYQNSPWWWWLFVIVGLGTTGFLAFSDTLGSSTFHEVVKVVFYLALLAHLGEAIYIYRLASRNGLSSVAWKWFFHCLVCGFWAIMLLQKIIAKRKAAVNS